MGEPAQLDHVSNETPAWSRFPDGILVAHSQES